MSDTTHQPKVYRKQGGDEFVVASGGTITVESGGTIEVESGGTLTIADGSLAVGDVTLAQGSVIVGNSSGVGSALSAKASGQILVGNGTTITSVAVSGDVTMDATGAVTIEAGAVESSMLANGAGLTSLITAGLGASAAYDKTTTGAQTLLAANGLGEGARTVLIIVTVDETFAAGDGAATIFDIGETDTAEKFKADLNSGTAGDVLTYAGSLTEQKALLVTATAATGTGAGGISIAVLALPAA